jgi:hypothetical protein
VTRRCHDSSAVPRSSLGFPGCTQPPSNRLSSSSEECSLFPCLNLQWQSPGFVPSVPRLFHVSAARNFFPFNSVPNVPSVPSWFENYTTSWPMRFYTRATKCGTVVLGNSIYEWPATPSFLNRHTQPRQVLRSGVLQKTRLRPEETLWSLKTNLGTSGGHVGEMAPLMNPE